MTGNEFVLNGKSAKRLGMETYKAFFADEALRLSAALAYYAIFSIAPFLIIVMAVAGLFFGREAVQGEISQQIEGLMGAVAAKTVSSMVAVQHRGSSLVASIIGIGIPVFGATGLVGQLQAALNTIWGMQAKPGRNILGLVKERVLSMAMVLVVAFLLLVSMVFSAAIHALAGRLGTMLPMSDTLQLLVNQVLGFAVAVLLFAMIFKFLPLVQTRWCDVWMGAFLTAVLFTAGKSVISYYLGREATTSAYGAAGSLVAMLLWVYYSSIILFLGAEFTKVYALLNGSPGTPKPGAVAVAGSPSGK